MFVILGRQKNELVALCMFTGKHPGASAMFEILLFPSGPVGPLLFFFASGNRRAL